MINKFLALPKKMQIFLIIASVGIFINAILIVLKFTAFYHLDFIQYAAELELNRGLENGDVAVFLSIVSVIQIAFSGTLFVLFFKIYKDKSSMTLPCLLLLVNAIIGWLFNFQSFAVFSALSYASPLKYVIILNLLMYVVTALMSVWVYFTRFRRQLKK